jgi:tight adherence protein B
MVTLLIAGAAFVGVACLVIGVASLMNRGGSAANIEDRLAILTGANGGGSRKSSESTNVLASPLNDAPDMIEQFFSNFFNLRKLLQQADSQLTPAKFGIISIALAVAGVLLPIVARVPIALAPFGVVLGAIPLCYILFKRKSRLAKFAASLPDALELISRALRAGHSLASGFKLVADEAGGPIATEFERCYEAQNLGQPLEEAIEEMTERVPNLDLRFFATAVVLQRQTGGDLAEILDKIGHLVRERYKIWGQIQALTGEGRLSGIVLLALPPVLAIVMWRLNPGYLMTLFTDPMGHQMLAFAIVMQIIGALVIRKIVNIKV